MNTLKNIKEIIFSFFTGFFIISLSIIALPFILGYLVLYGNCHKTYKDYYDDFSK